MCRSMFHITTVLSVFLSAAILGGCGSSNREGAEAPTATANRVGSTTCTNTCHAASKDITGTDIATAWANTSHTTVQGVQCEDCHGPGGMHWGIGPMPFPVPQAAQCAQAKCHASFEPAFDLTAHANSHATGTPFGPDKFFFQGSADGTQAANRPRGSRTAVPEVTPAGVPVSKAQHIQECSVCHNPNQRFVNYSGNLVRPSQAQSAASTQNGTTGQFDFPNPAVSCAGCHDAHQPQQLSATVPQRSAQVGYPIFRKFNVNSQDAIVPMATAGSTTIAGIIYQPNGAAVGGTVTGKNNEINPDQVCAPCHTVGRYLFNNMSTHQTNVHPQWSNSAHAERNDPAWAEFSANPGAYTDPDTGAVYTAVGHRTTYPIDLSKTSFGATANATQNQGNNNFACFKCHNGLGAAAYMRNVQGTSAAPVIFGDVTATCITCHSPHANGRFANLSTTSNNIRVPVAMTNYSTTSAKVFGNVFLDTKPIPPPSQADNSIVCIFCHQGRESGYTLFKTKLAAGKTITGSFFNPHYLGTAAMLWGANGYEYAGKSYSANTAHQGVNCVGCHMANATVDTQTGGHSWNPNVASCNTSSCHGGAVPPAVGAQTGTASPDVSTYRATADTTNYSGDAGGATQPVAVAIQSVQQKLIALLQAQSPPIYFNDLAYPYFFANPTFTTNFTAWTPKTYKAAFNLQFTIKGLPSGATSQANVPNTSAAVHDHLYIIQLLLDSYEDVSGAPLAGATRPPGTRAATVYGTGQ